MLAPISFTVAALTGHVILPWSSLKSMTTALIPAARAPSRTPFKTSSFPATGPVM